MAKADGKSLNVQVPGETSDPTSNTAQDQGEEYGTGPALTLADVGLAADQPNDKPVRRHIDMHSSEVDPKTLTAPVKCKDGWLCPHSEAKKA